MTEKELIEKILDKIDSMNSSVNELNKEMKEFRNELSGETKPCRAVMNELKEVPDSRFSVVNEKLDNIIEINNKLNLKG